MKKVNNREEYLTEINGLLTENPTCVEIGVETGGFSRMIYDYLKPKKLYLIDPWEVGYDKRGEEKTYTGVLQQLPTAHSTEEQYQQVITKFSGEIESGRIECKRDYSYNVVNSFPDGHFDFIYIDSCHLYGCVKSDLEIFLPKLKDGGLMCGHDYTNMENFGVVQAVDEFCVEHDFKMILLSPSTAFDWALIKNKK